MGGKCISNYLPVRLGELAAAQLVSSKCLHIAALLFYIRELHSLASAARVYPTSGFLIVYLPAMDRLYKLSASSGDFVFVGFSRAPERGR